MYKELIPIMTSNENNNIKITCSSFYTTESGNRFEPYLAFDKNVNTYWNFEGAINPGNWIKIEFKAGIPRISKMILSNGNGASASIKDFILQGSNDDSTYITIINGYHPYGENNTTSYLYELGSVSYKYYKLIVKSSYYTAPTYYGGIGELQLIGIAYAFLIKQNNQYYSIKPEFYQEESDEYNSPVINTLNISNFDDYGLDDLSEIHSNALNKLIEDKYNIVLLV